MLHFNLTLNLKSEPTFDEDFGLFVHACGCTTSTVDGAMAIVTFCGSKHFADLFEVATKK